MPNSPTLMNAGRKQGILSACLVLPVQDIRAITERWSVDQRWTPLLTSLSVTTMAKTTMVAMPPA